MLEWLFGSSASSSRRGNGNHVPRRRVGSNLSIPADAFEVPHLQVKVKLPAPLTAPSGRRLTTVNADVIGTFTIDKSGDPKLHSIKQESVSLAGIMGNGSSLDGELINIGRIQNWLLFDAAQSQLSKERSHFRQQVMEVVKRDARWQSKHELAGALERGDVTTAAALMAAAAKNSRMTFMYTKADGSKSLRTVIVHSVTGNTIRATEVGGETTKQFRIDRISRVKGA